MCSCGGKKKDDIKPPAIKTPSDSPGGVVVAYQMALLDGDFSKAWEYISEETKENTGGFDAFRQKFASDLQNEKLKQELKNTVVREAKTEGDKAQVKIEFPLGGDTDKMRSRLITLVKEDKKWKISQVGDSQ